ncbi:MAG: hypothetical protein U0271_32755 [Polyangiaceae bacterium]
MRGFELGSRRLVFLAALTACATPTQITLELTTNALCVEDTHSADHLLDTLIVAAPTLAGADYTETTVTEHCESGTRSWIGTLVFLPGDGNDAKRLDLAVFAGVVRPDGVTQMDATACRNLYVQARSIAGAPCILARRRLGFVDHQKLSLPVFLSTECIGVDCGEDQTCANGTCVSAEVDCDENGSCPDPGLGGAGGGASGGAGGAGGSSNTAGGAGGLGAGGLGAGGNGVGGLAGGFGGLGPGSGGGPGAGGGGFGGIGTGPGPTTTTGVGGFGGAIQTTTTTTGAGMVGVGGVGGFVVMPTVGAGPAGVGGGTQSIGSGPIVAGGAIMMSPAPPWVSSADLNLGTFVVTPATRLRSPEPFVSGAFEAAEAHDGELWLLPESNGEPLLVPGAAPALTLPFEDPRDPAFSLDGAGGLELCTDGVCVGVDLPVDLSGAHLTHLSRLGAGDLGEPRAFVSGFDPERGAPVLLAIEAPAFDDAEVRFSRYWVEPYGSDVRALFFDAREDGLWLLTERGLFLFDADLSSHGP